MKTRNTFYLPTELQSKLDRLAAIKNLPRTTIIEAAVSSFLSPDAEDTKEAAFTRRLDKMSRQINRLERDMHITLDTLALFIQFWLTTTAPLSSEFQAQAKAKGQQRFEGFIAALGKRLQQGRHFRDEIPEDKNNET